jgi:hypothetical protein
VKWWRDHPLLAVAITLIGAYITMAEWNRGDDGPRTFVAALAAMALGAWIYAIAQQNACRQPDDDVDRDGLERGFDEDPETVQRRWPPD